MVDLVKMRDVMHSHHESELAIFPVRNAGIVICVPTSRGVPDEVGCAAFEVLNDTHIIEPDHEIDKPPIDLDVFLRFRDWDMPCLVARQEQVSVML